MYIRIRNLALTALVIAVVLFGACSSSTTLQTTPATPRPAISPVTPTSTTANPAPASGNLTVYFIDVGQGDSILINSGNTDVLIDGGEASAHVANLIKPYVHGDIEAVIATHYHSDHIGGLTDVFRSYKVDDAFWNGETDTTQAYKEWKLAMDNSGAKERIVKRGDVIQEGALTFNVLDPVVTTNTDPNQNSIVVTLKYGKGTFLFTGDAGKPVEDDLLAAGLLGYVDVLKVGHHASDTATSQEFVDKIKPVVAVYECGVNNQYGFPKPDVIARLQAAGATVYGTDVNGTVEFSTDGQSYAINVEKQAPLRKPMATPTVTSAPTTTSATSGNITLEIVSVSSPIAAGRSATLVAKTSPGAQCKITVYYKSGPSSAAGLSPKVADANGSVSWTWTVGNRTTPGSWKIVVTASSNNQTTSQTTYFTVK